MVPILLLAVVALGFIAASAGGASASQGPSPHPALGPGLPPPPLPPAPVPQNAPADGGSTQQGGLGGLLGNLGGALGGLIQVAPQQTAPTTPRQVAAVAMVNELNRVGGFREYDQPIYKAYQSAAGLTVDGFPGTHTMNSLFTDAAALGIDPPPVPVFAWKARTGTLQDYDGVNAPLASEWLTPAPN